MGYKASTELSVSLLQPKYLLLGYIYIAFPMDILTSMDTS